MCVKRLCVCVITSVIPSASLCVAVYVMCVLACVCVHVCGCACVHACGCAHPFMCMCV